MKASPRGALVLAAAVLTSTACAESPAQPSPPPPATSTLTFQVAAGTCNPASSWNYTTANATFEARVRTTCVPNPNIAGSVCPDLIVIVRGADGGQCVMWAFAPVGTILRIGSYPKASFSPTTDTAGFFINCARAGTACGDNASAFTIHGLRSGESGQVTHLHMTFEQTCLGGFPPTVGHFGTGTGELWIVDGTGST